MQIARREHVQPRGATLSRARTRGPATRRLREPSLVGRHRDELMVARGGGDCTVHEDEYTIIEDIVAPGQSGEGHHLVDYQTQELVSTLWSKYLAQIRGSLPSSAVLPAMRRVTYTLDNEAFAGQTLR